MTRIRKIHAKNFRALKEFQWSPSPGINCIIGAGDSGKSTILDIIDIVLGVRHTYPFSDADFHKLDTRNPIEIWLTMGDLPHELKNIEKFGSFLRGYDPVTQLIHDEPLVGYETVVTIKLTVTEDLDPDWRLYSERAEREGIERRLPWKQKETISAARLGATSHHHLSWGNRSILNKFSEESLDVSSTLAEISRQTRQSFANHQIDNVDEVLNSVKEIATSLGVTVGNLQAQLDIKGASLTSGSIGLHDEDNTPLRQLGTGSSRLLISGLHKAASNSNILLVDEAEYGLEPYRISRLLNELGSKDELPTKQVFLTTHSPHVLQELKASQLHVLRPQSEAAQASHIIYSLDDGNDEQATLRACPEAFLSKRIIICEGKTEIGLLRGIDIYAQSQTIDSFYANGTVCTDGGGDNLFIRAHVLNRLGYPVIIFKDSDKEEEHRVATAQANSVGITIHEWGNNYAIEDALFLHCPANAIPPLIQLAIERKGKDSVDAVIRNQSGNAFGLNECMNSFNESMRGILALSAKNKSWFKDIDPAERIGRDIVSPYYNLFNDNFTNVINNIFHFARTRT